jgi:site-specific DNA recombinase
VLSSLHRVVVGDNRIEVTLQADALRSIEGSASDEHDGFLVLRLAFEMRKRQGAVILEAPGQAPTMAGKPDRALVRAVVLARRWAAELGGGVVPSIKALARREGLCHHYTARLLPLAYLSPQITDAILAGKQPGGLARCARGPAASSRLDAAAAAARRYGPD